jgi:UDP-2,3-diacylglucosamine hydrolase
MACYIFSDAHLGGGTAGEEQIKRAKLQQLFQIVEKDATRLIILGDLFDFWFEYRYTIPKGYHWILSRLFELRKKGIQIDYVSGNHDFWMGDFFQTELGVAVHRDILNTEIDGRKVHLIHGDGLAKSDWGYRILKRILRNRLNIWLYRKVPTEWAYTLALKVSRGSRVHTSERDKSFVSDYEQYAIEKLQQGFAAVFIAHLHQPIRVDRENGVYINTGDFISHFSYVRIDRDRIELLSV